jgi:hypothetical protein
MKRRQFLGTVSTVVGAAALTGAAPMAGGVMALGAPASPDPALQGVSPENFYVSLVKAIDQAEGRVRFFLYKGCWTTSVGGTTVRWKIESANQKAIVRFKYVGGVVDSAEIKFQPAIKVGVPTVTSNGVMLWNTIERITYGDGGEVIEPPVLSDSYEVEQHFRLAATPEQIFQGQPFANANAFTPEVGPDCPAPQEPTFFTLVREVELLPDPANNLQAFKAVFKPNSTIRFSADNLITLADSGSFTPVIPIIPAAETPNSVVIQNLNFKTKTRVLKANLRQFNLVLASASFNTRNFSLNLAGNSSLIFANVDVTRGEDGTARVDSSDGRLTAMIGNASKVKFAEAANETNFTLNDKSKIDLRGFVLNINDRESTKVTVGPESIITVGFHSGTIGFGQKGSLSVDEGGVSFVAKAPCTWGGGPPGNPAPISLQGEFTSLDAKIISGTIPLTDTNVVELRPGTVVKATKLELDTALRPALAGSFDTVVVKGAPNGNLSLLRGLDIRVKDSGVTITATDPLARLTIDRNRPYPTGRYVTECSYETLDFTAGPVLRMVNGFLNVDITNVPGGPDGLIFRGNSIHFDGDMIEGDVSLGNLGGMRLAGRTDPLGRKNVILDVKGEWALNQTERPRITGKLTHIGVDITSGNLKLNELSRLDISGGRFVADGLDVDTGSSRPITGRIRSMALDVREDSRFGLQNSFSLVSKARKDAFLAEDTAAPLTLPPGSGMPYGAFRVWLDYKKATNGNLVLTDGFFDFPLVAAADGSVSGRNIRLSGDSNIAGPGVTVPIHVALERGTLEYAPTQPPVIVAELTVSTREAFDLTVTSPGMDSNTNPEWKDGHEDRVIWPITIRPRINAFSLPTTTVTFKGSRLNFNTGEFHIPVTAAIPEGLGEHDPSELGGHADGTHPSDDDLKNAQEFFSETFTKHRLHAYLKPGSVRFNPLISIEHTDDTLLVSLKALNLLDGLPVKTDGIEDVAEAILAAVGFLIGTLITGNPVAGAIAGIVAGNVAKDKIEQAKAMALLRIADRISHFSRDFPFKIPTP